MKLLLLMWVVACPVLGRRYVVDVTRKGATAKPIPHEALTGTMPELLDRFKRMGYIVVKKDELQKLLA